MTGNQVIALVRKVKGKLYAGVLATDSVFYIAVEKKDVIEVVKPYGDTECGLTLRDTAGQWYLESD